VLIVKKGQGMSKAHPIFSITGSAGAGSTTLKVVLDRLLKRKNINVKHVLGDSFRRHDFETWDKVVEEFRSGGRNISHFGPEANQFEKIQELFKNYSETGQGEVREYLSTHDLAKEHQGKKGGFSEFSAIEDDTDLLFYDGFHGGLVTDKWSRRKLSESHNPEVIKLRKAFDNAEHGDIDVAQYVDLLIGVVPSMNLEWIQKIHRDVKQTGIHHEDVTSAILRRMPDYIHFILPQFLLTDINFQRVPLIDTSDPFFIQDIPTLDESMIVARFREPAKYDFPYFLNNIEGSFMSRPNTLVIPGCEFEYAVMAIFEPIIDEMFDHLPHME
jgi:phosphoribulokinase